MCMGGSSGESAMSAAAEGQRQSKIKEGKRRIDDAFAGFNDQFYADRQDAYEDFATPQLETQFTDANRKVRASLARAGTQNSSVAARRFSELQRAYDSAKQQVNATALNVANDARTSVADNKSQLVNLLVNSGDADAAASGAAARASSMTTLPTFNPLGAIFQNITGAIALDQQAKSEGYPGIFGSNKQQPTTGMSSGSSRIVR